MEEKKLIKRKRTAFVEGNLDSQASACNNLGDFYKQRKKYTQAAWEYEQEASIYRMVGKKLRMGRAHRMAGEMYLILLDFLAALNHFHIYLKAVSNMNMKIDEQRAYDSLGRTYLLQAQSTSDEPVAQTLLRNAEKAYIRSLLISKEFPGTQIPKTEQKRIQARLFLNLGVVREYLGELEEAIEYMEKAIKMSKTHEIHDILHLSYLTLSQLYLNKQFDPKQALRYCNLALETDKNQRNNAKNICESLLVKTGILIKEGDFTNAKLILTRAYRKNTPDDNDRQTIEKALRVVGQICRTLDRLVAMGSDDQNKRRKLFNRLGGGIRRLSPIVSDGRRKQLMMVDLKNSSKSVICNGKI